MADNPSVVDFLDGQGKDSSFEARSNLAAEQGIQNFTGTAEQNTQLLGNLSQGVQAPEQPTADQGAPVIKEDGEVSTQGGTVLEKPTPTLNERMEEFSKGKGVNAAGEELAPPSQSRVDEFNKQFTTTKEEPAGKPLADEDLSDELVSFIQVQSEKGISKEVSVMKFKAALAKRGFDTSTFDDQFEPVLNELDGLNFSEDDFLKQLQAGGQFNSFIQNNSPEFQLAKKRFDRLASFNKSQAGINLGVANGTLEDNPVLFSDLFQNAATAEMLRTATKSDIQKKAEEDDVKLGSLNVSTLSKSILEINRTLGIDPKRVAKDLKNDPDLKLNREGFAESSGRLASLYQERKKLRKEIEGRFKNASPSFIQAVYNREVGVLNDKIEEATEESANFKMNYDMKLGEKQIGYEAEFKATEQGRLNFSNLLNTYNQEAASLRNKDLAILQEGFIRQRNQIQNEEKARIADVNVSKWISKPDGTIAGINAKGEVVSELVGYAEPVSADDGITNMSTKYHEDGSSTVTYIKDGKIMQQQFGESGEGLVVNDYTNDLGPVTSYGNRVDGDNGLDIAKGFGEDFESPFNGTVVNVSGPRSTTSGFGNWITIDDGNGNHVRFAHLKGQPAFKKGDLIGAGTVLGQVGNSGFVLTEDKNSPGDPSMDIPPGWRLPTGEERAQGKGAHLDITSWDSEGNVRDGHGTEDFLNGGDITIDGTLGSGPLGEGEGIMGSGFSAGTVNRALSRVPVKLRDAASEKENFQEVAIEALKANGGDVGKAILEVAGWKVDNPDNATILNKLNNILLTRSLGDVEIGPLSSAINSSDENTVASGITALEDAALGNNPTNKGKTFIDRGNVIDVIEKTSNLQTQLDSVESRFFGGTGLWDGRISSAQAVLGDEEFAKFTADMENLFGPIRTEKFGVNLTDNEQSFLENFMPDIRNDQENIKAKLNSLKDNTITSYNSRRRATSLVSLTEDELLNPSSLVNKYREGGTTTGVNVAPPSTYDNILLDYNRDVKNEPSFLK